MMSCYKIESKCLIAALIGFFCVLIHFHLRITISVVLLL